MTGPDLIALVGCVKTKLVGVHAARHLDASPLFAGRRSYVETRRMPGFILSAKYGLVPPDEPIRDYEMTLNSMSAAERRAWGERVTITVQDRLGDLRTRTFEVHAGARYVDAIDEGLRALGAELVVPTAGLGLGEQRRWYREAGRAINLDDTLGGFEGLRQTEPPFAIRSPTGEVSNDRRGDDPDAGTWSVL